MKRVVTVILAVALIAALALPAIADALTLYATKNGVKVYAAKRTDAKVYKKLSRGQKVLIEKKSGKWYAILVQDPSGDGQTLGWIQAKYLSSTKPSKEKKKDRKKSASDAKPAESARKEIDRVLGTMQDVEPYEAELVTKTEKGTVALRWQPTTDGKLILHIMNGARLKVLAEGDGWSQVTDPKSGYTGYMASSYLVRTGEAAEVEAGDAETEGGDAAEASGNRTVSPLEAGLDVNHLPDGAYPAAFDRGDVARLASGIYMNGVRVYTMDLYAAADIEGLAGGDTVVVEGETLAVRTVESDGDVVRVNGGLGEEGGCDFRKTGTGDYCVDGYDDLPTYTALGTTSLAVDESAVFTDGSDIDSDPVTVDYDGIIDAMQGAPIDAFSADNTTLTIRSGKVTRIDRVYVP